MDSDFNGGWWCFAPIIGRRYRDGTRRSTRFFSFFLLSTVRFRCSSSHARAPLSFYSNVRSDVIYRQLSPPLICFRSPPTPLDISSRYLYFQRGQAIRVFRSNDHCVSLRVIRTTKPRINKWDASRDFRFARAINEERGNTRSSIRFPSR